MMNSIMILAAAAPDISEALAPIYSILAIVTPTLLTLVFAIAVPYCISLGVRLAKADDAQTREEAKTKIKQAIIGFVLIFVFIAVVWLIQEPMMEWLSDVTEGGIRG